MIIENIANKYSTILLLQNDVDLDDENNAGLILFSSLYSTNLRIKLPNFKRNFCTNRIENTKTNLIQKNNFIKHKIYAKYSLAFIRILSDLH